MFPVSARHFYGDLRVFFLSPSAASGQTATEVAHTFRERSPHTARNLIVSAWLALALRKFLLLQDQRSKIFWLAEREIRHLLADNLLVKFKASSPCKELVQDETVQVSPPLLSK